MLRLLILFQIEHTQFVLRAKVKQLTTVKALKITKKIKHGGIPHGLDCWVQGYDSAFAGKYDSDRD